MNNAGARPGTSPGPSQYVQYGSQFGRGSGRGGLPVHTNQAHNTSSPPQNVHSVPNHHLHQQGHPGSSPASLANSIPESDHSIHPQNQSQMLGGSAPSSYDYSYSDQQFHQQQQQHPQSDQQGQLQSNQLHDISPTSSQGGLDYETFWRLQQQYGVAPLRDNLNYAAAQNRTLEAVGMGLEPYSEPMYAYKGHQPQPQMQNQYSEGGGYNFAGEANPQRDQNGHTLNTFPDVQQQFNFPNQYNPNPELQHPTPQNVLHDHSQFNVHPVQQQQQQQQGAVGDYTSPGMSSNHSVDYIPPQPAPPLSQHMGHSTYQNNPSLVHGEPMQQQQQHPQAVQHIQQGMGETGQHQFPSTSEEFKPQFSNTSAGRGRGMQTQAQAPFPSSPSPSYPFPTTSNARQRVFNPVSLASGGGQAQPTIKAEPQRQPTISTTGSKGKGKKETRKAPKSRKRRRSQKEDSETSESEDERNQIALGPDGVPVRKTGACTHCKKLKMRCEFENPSDIICKRCRNTRHVCIVEGRKPRTQPNKREYLLAQIRQRDQIIKKLLDTIHNPSSVNRGTDELGDEVQQALNVQAAPDVVAWLERAQASVRAGVGPFVLDSRAGKDIDDGSSDLSHEGDYSHNISNESFHDSDLLNVPDERSLDPGTDKERLHSLPGQFAPLGVIAGLSLDSKRARSRSRSRSRTKSDSSYGNQSKEKAKGPGSDELGVAAEDYFLPVENHNLRAALLFNQPPDIMVHGLVTPQDVENLFQIFYEKLNPFLSILDPKLHTPSSTFSRCPFLFTTICAISSRYYNEKSHIYTIAIHFAKQAAARNLIDGWKCVEQCQAYLLLSLYAMPARKWEDDRSWIYLGVAIRIATDLNLHHPTHVRKIESELHERELLNRTRTWMILFNLDRSTSTQLGKPSTIREDYIIYQSDTWYRSSQYNHPYDVHLCAYSELLRLTASFHDRIYNGPLGLRPGIDLPKMTLVFDKELDDFQVRTANNFKAHSNPHDAGAQFRCKMLPLLVDYSRLVMFSFGYQKAFQQGLEDEKFSNKVLNTAMNVLSCFVDSLAPSGYMRYSPDGHFVFVSFASAFLIKLLRAKVISERQREEVQDAIQRLIDTLKSPDIAIDDKHTPKLYARFLQTLLSEEIADEEEAEKIRESPGTENSSNPNSSGHGTQRSSEGSDEMTQKQHSNTPQAQGSGTGDHGPDTPSISLEYAPIGGEPHVQVLQDSSGRLPSSGQEFPGLAPPLFSPTYDERFSNASGTVVERGDDGDASTQHGGEKGQGMNDGQLGQNEMLASMRLLSNPHFFNHMMMPPYNPSTWSESSMDTDPQASHLDAFSRNFHQGYASNPSLGNGDQNLDRP